MTGAAFAMPRSLRRRLLIWLVSVHLVAAAGVIWYSYLNIGRIIVSTKDDQMLSLIESYSTHATPPPLRAVDETAVRRGAFVVQFFDGDGRLLASSWPGLKLGLQAEPGVHSVWAEGGHKAEWRVSATPANSNTGGMRVQVAQSMDFLRELVTRRAVSAAAPIALLLPLTLAVLWLVVTHSSRALRAVADDVSKQDENSVSELPIHRVPAEIVPLVSAFNALLGRLRAAFMAQRRFLQDAAHELRTPVAVIGLQVENLRPHIASGEGEELYEQLEAGIARAHHVTEQLLRLSREENEPRQAPAPIDVVAVLRDSIGRVMVLADQRQIDVGFHAAISPTIQASAADLHSVFDNLIDNAIRHSPVGSTVDVHVHELEKRPVVDVIDNGAGIPDYLLERVFDRFFRVPGTAADGSGLGLAIASAAAQRSGMRIQLLSGDRASARGLTARVVLS